jgi:hypothetical protein
MVTKMYVAVGMDREPPEQSVEYLAWVRSQHTEFSVGVDPFGAILDPLSSIEGVDTHPDHERAPMVPQTASTVPSPVPSPTPPRPSFTATPTGRRARGQLEYDVLRVCREYSENYYDWDACTPKLVAERIGIQNAIEPPSTGAINAVWDRWEKLQFAEQAKKPSRFVGFLGPSDDATLDRMKSKVKREKKRTQAEIKRGSLRPRGR